MTRLRREWKCNYCNCIFDSSTKLLKHKKENHLEECKNHIFKLNKSKRNPDGWLCNYCGKKFESKRILYNHIHELHPQNCYGKRQIKKQWICNYCNSEFKTRTKLYEHYKICEEKNKLPHDSLGRIISEEGHKNAGKSLHKKYSSGELKYIKHTCSSETRANLAMKMKERRQIVNFQCNYNPKACEYMDKLNKENHWNLQHALNGGEIHVGPYSLDGYDKELNIAFEYDENTAHHNSEKNKLKDKFRQEYIIEKLNCEFWRYSEKDDILYKILNE